MTILSPNIKLFMFGGESFWKMKIMVVIANRIITRITAHVPVLPKSVVMRVVAAAA